MTSSVVGTVEMTRLDSVKPNPWNPNTMTPRLKESLKKGLEDDGWIASQAILVLGTDKDGTEHNIIIDGEHRWTVAKELGFEEGPMVVLNGISVTEAKALTIKMNQKRGEWDEGGLVSLLKDIEFEVGGDDLGLDLGFEDEDVMRYLATDDEPEDLETSEGGDHKAEVENSHGATVKNTEDLDEGQTDNHVRLVQLFFDKEQHDYFQEKVKELCKVHGTKTITDTVLAVFKGT